MYYITTSTLGLFAVDDKNNLVASQFFSDDAKIAARQYNESLKKELSNEEKELLKKLKKDDAIIFEIKKERYDHISPNPAGDYVRSNLFNLASKNNLSAADFSIYQYAINFELTKYTMQSQHIDDKLIIQAVSAIDDLDKTINIMCMRLREWYSLYFPEASEKLKDNERFAKYVSEVLFRKDLDNFRFEETIGSDMKKTDLEEERLFAKSIESLLIQRKNLETYIDKKCREVIPNMAAIIGAEQASRILAHAGSTEKLAKFPSSTIQILGAEKALFRYLHNVGTSPKHGLIFNTGYIQRTPREQRGKIARILASKLSLASKIDHYKGEFKGDLLKADMEKALEHVLRAKPKLKKDRVQKFQTKRPHSVEGQTHGQRHMASKDNRPPFKHSVSKKDNKPKTHGYENYLNERQAKPSHRHEEKPHGRNTEKAKSTKDTFRKFKKKKHQRR